MRVPQLATAAPAPVVDEDTLSGQKL
jgi:hypothetical protein